MFFGISYRWRGPEKIYLSSNNMPNAKLTSNPCSPPSTKKLLFPIFLFRNTSSQKRLKAYIIPRTSLNHHCRDSYKWNQCWSCIGDKEPTINGDLKSYLLVQKCVMQRSPRNFWSIICSRDEKDASPKVERNEWAHLPCWRMVPSALTGW